MSWFSNIFYFFSGWQNKEPKNQMKHLNRPKYTKQICKLEKKDSSSIFDKIFDLNLFFLLNPLFDCVDLHKPSVLLSSFHENCFGIIYFCWFVTFFWFRVYYLILLFFIFFLLPFFILNIIFMVMLSFCHIFFLFFLVETLKIC